MKPRKNSAFHKALTVFVLVVGSPVVAAIFVLVIFNDLLFGRYRGWNYNYIIFKRVFDFGYFMSGIRLRTFYETPHDRTKKYVFVLNHIAYFDIPVMMSAIRQPIRILGKAGPHKIPIFGYYYRKSTVMVDRSSILSRSRSITDLKHYLEKGISIVICPEGTFNTTHRPVKHFYDGAFRIAIETQTNIKPVLMLDNYDRQYYHGLSLEPGKCRVVYLEEVNVQGLTLNDVETLKTQVQAQMSAALRRYRASWINDNEADTGNGSEALAV